MAYTETDIWKDPRVIDALKDGRSADDIAILDCPKCGLLGYYNQGSHFTCLRCDQTFYVLSEGESRPDAPCVYANEAIMLEDTLEAGME